jgi:hypothetical protein
MLNKSRIMTAAAAVTLSIAALPALGDTVPYVFDPLSGQSFGSGSANTSVTIGNATFTQANSSAASYDFVFGPNGGLFSNIGGGSGTVLSTAGNAGANPSGAPASLTISFSSTVYGINFDYANSDFVYTPNGGDTLTASISNGATVTANPTFSATNGDFYAEGAFSYASANGFNSITLTSTDAAGAEDLVLGDLTTQTTPVPVPAAFWMLLSGIGGGIGFARRRAGAQKAAVVA